MRKAPKNFHEQQDALATLSAGLSVRTIPVELWAGCTRGNLFAEFDMMQTRDRKSISNNTN